MIFQVDRQGTGHEQKIQRHRAKGLKNTWERELKRHVYWDCDEVVVIKLGKGGMKLALTCANQKHDFCSVRDCPFTAQDLRPVR